MLARKLTSLANTFRAWTLTGRPVTSKEVKAFHECLCEAVELSSFMENEMIVFEGAMRDDLPERAPPQSLPAAAILQPRNLPPGVVDLDAVRAHRTSRTQESRND